MSLRPLRFSLRFPFVLTSQELTYFRQGFGSILLGRADGRHQFFAPQATFSDSLILRSPLAGPMQVSNLAVTAAPLTLVGSGQGTELTSGSPTLSATTVSVNNNIIVDSGASGSISATSGDVSITGSGGGNIDGATGSTNSNLSIAATGNVVIGGSVGSSVPLNNLTLSSTGATPGNITIQGGTTLLGNLTILSGQTVTFGSNVTVHGSVLIDPGAAVSFDGPVNVTGDFSVTQATSVSFAANVNVTGNFTIGDPTDLTQVQTLTFGANARLDVGGAVAIYTQSDITFGNSIGQSSPPASITLETQSGDINFQNTVISNGLITVINANNVTFSQRLTAPDLEILLATGQTRFNSTVTLGQMNITSVSQVQIVNTLTLTSGSGTLTTNTITFQGGSASINYTGSGTSNFTVKPYDVTRAITIGSPPGVFTSLDISDQNLAAIAPGFSHVNFGDSTSGTGTVTIGSIGSQEGLGNSQLVNNTSIYGGAINVVQNVDSAVLAGTLSLVAANGNITISGAINSVSAEPARYRHPQDAQRQHHHQQPGLCRHAAADDLRRIHHRHRPGERPDDARYRRRNGFADQRTRIM